MTWGRGKTASQCRRSPGSESCLIHSLGVASPTGMIQWEVTTLTMRLWQWKIRRCTRSIVSPTSGLWSSYLQWQSTATTFCFPSLSSSAHIQWSASSSIRPWPDSYPAISCNGSAMRPASPPWKRSCISSETASASTASASACSFTTPIGQLSISVRQQLT